MIDSNIFRDQMTIRRLRLAAGLIMLSYLTLHLSMHALGNVSFEAMQWGTRIHDFVWHSVPGTIVLYGAFAIHLTPLVASLCGREVCIFSVRCDAPLRRSAHRLFFLCSVLGVAASHRAPGRLDAWLPACITGYVRDP